MGRSARQSERYYVLDTSSRRQHKPPRTSHWPLSSPPDLSPSPSTALTLPNDLYLFQLMAELFFSGVAHSATEADVQEALAKALHRPPISRSHVPCNFSVNVFSNKNKYNKLSTCANVTIADADVAERFLDQYGQRPGFHIAGRYARVMRSKRPVDEARVTQLKANKYEDPHSKRAREIELERLREPITLASLEFGTVKHDGGGAAIFSSVYKRPLSGAVVFLDGQKRLLVISAGPLKVTIALNSVRSLQINSDPPPPATLLSLTHAPTYLHTSSGTMEELFAAMLLNRDPFAFRQAESSNLKTSRISAIDLEHGKVAHIYQNLLLTFPSSHSLEQFKHRRSDEIRLHKIYSIRLRTEAPTPTIDFGTFERLLGAYDMRIAFQLELLYRNVILAIDEIAGLLPSVTLLVQKHPAEQVERILSRFASKLVKVSGEHWRFDDVNEELYDVEDDGPSTPVGQVRRTAFASAPNLVAQLEQVAKTTSPVPPYTSDILYSRHVVLTPTSMRLECQLDDSNSVIRRFPGREHYFLRVSLREEDMSTIFDDCEIDMGAFLFARFGDIFGASGGLDVGGRTFKYLCHSMSSLRSHSTFFVAPFYFGGEWISAESIRRSLGDFSNVIDNPARLMARISQAFTATSSTLELDPLQIQAIADIESSSGSCFTDGVGKISPALAEEIDAILAARRPGRRGNRVQSSCYQIRLGGAKGMLSVDPLLDGKVVQVRPSQLKFNSLTRSLEIANVWDRALPCYLNKPLIGILGDLGIEANVFLERQAEAIERVSRARTTLKDGANLLERVGLGAASKLSTTLRDLSRLLPDLSAQQIDPFLESCVDAGIVESLKQLKFRARIQVNGHVLVGVADEDGYLQEGEIYACVQNSRNERPLYIEGDVCNSRSPTIHPGDVRVVKAVGRIPSGVAPRLSSMNNCVVFSIHGSRSLPSMLGSGDLDGDLYSVFLDPDLIPLRRNIVEPADYSPPVMNRLPRPATIDDGRDFFFDYIISDLLGVISSRHLHTADLSLQGSMDRDCIELARLHSKAVDYPKTGSKVTFKSLPPKPSDLRPSFMTPEFTAHRKGNNKLYYTSNKPLGQLYRAIPLKDVRAGLFDVEEARLDPARTVTNAFLAHRPRSSSTPPLSISPPSPLSQEMEKHLAEFCAELFHIAQNNTLSHRNDRHLSEVEVFLGTIAAPAKAHRQRQDQTARLNLQSSTLYDMLTDSIRGAEDAVEGRGQVVERSWAAWMAAVDAGGTEYGVKSFGLVALQVLLEGLTELDGQE